ncbi:MAG: hypothetical protein RI963_831 [Planctomycetota bacterium]
MMSWKACVCCLALFAWATCVLVTEGVLADEPKSEPKPAEKSEPKPAEKSEPKPPEEPLTAEAQAMVEQLRASLPKDSEAIAMLEDILKGSRLGPKDGWFPLAVSQTRFGWDYVAKAYDADGDKGVKRDEFPGSDDDFNRLDRDRNRRIDEADFDWSEHSMMPKPGLILFFMADRDANGKVTKEEFAGLFEMLGGDKEGFLAIDDVRDEFKPWGGGGPGPDRPSRSTLVMGLKRQEIGSLQSGPRLDEIAPDFTLKTIDGKEVTLSKEIGDQPIVLIFGNFTCGPFRSQAGNIDKLYRRYQDRAKVFLVYVREAHPAEGWWMLSNREVGIELSQPADDAGRLAAATQCQRHLDLDLPLLVDGVDDRVGATYSGMPNRLYLIDRDGKVAFKNGRGPFGFHPRQLEQALVLLLNSAE